MASPGKAASGDGADPPRMLAGGCRCGAVPNTVPDAFHYAAICHCSGCRAATGSAFKPFAGIERDKLEITHGVDRIAVFGDETDNDTHCADCGCFLYSLVGTVVHVSMGSLLDTPSRTRRRFVNATDA